MIWLNTVWPVLGCTWNFLLEHGEAQQHHAQDRTRQQLGALGPNDPGLLEEGHTVGNGLHPGEGAAAGREGLQHQEDAHGLDVCESTSECPIWACMQAERVDQANGDDGQ
jgi:hypothetical protein